MKKTYIVPKLKSFNVHPCDALLQDISVYNNREIREEDAGLTKEEKSFDWDKVWNREY